jgi:hypothetical protein
MELDRRTLMKGLVAGGAALAFGSSHRVLADVPGSAAASCGLLLGHAEIEAAFERGARALLTRVGHPEPEVVRWKGGPLTTPSALPAQLDRSSATRWIVVLDDAGAAVFQEMIRSAGVRLLSRGGHACSAEGSAPFRHEWVAASPRWSAGALLASLLHEGDLGFSIAESFLGEAEVAPTALERNAFLKRSDDWVECVGQAVAASALELGAGREAPASVERARDHERRLPTRRFASFVIEL